MLSIDDFWRARLGGAQAPLSSALSGWQAGVSPLAGYVEPTFTVIEGDPQTAKVIIVSAPGAVGKTSLAKQIASVTAFVSVDLASTSPLGGNFFTGGASNAFGNDALMRIEQGQLGLIVDGLDEGELRAPPQGFSSALTDLAKLASQKDALPAVLLARSLVAEAAYLIVSDTDAAPCLISIDFFDEVRAEEFIRRRLQILASEQPPAVGSAYNAHRTRFEDFALETLSSLREASGGERRFTGYAPVLDAICAFALDESQLNPQARIGSVGGQTQVDVIRAICEGILDRERGKLFNQLTEALPEAAEYRGGVYTPDYQRQLVSHRLYNAPRPQQLPVANDKVATRYGEMVEDFLPNHPFISGDGKSAANSVFASYLMYQEMISGRSATVRRIFDQQPTAATGLTFDLFNAWSSKQSGKPVNLLDTGILYQSATSQAVPNERVGLEITAGDDEEDLADVQIEFYDRKTGEETRLGFVATTVLDDSLALRTPVSTINVYAPIWVELGDSRTFSMEAPSQLDVATLELDAAQLFLQRSPGEQTAQAVTIIAQEANVSQVRNVTTNGVQLSVTWPGVSQYPWHAYAFEPPLPPNPEIQFMRRRLRGILTAFRSHSKGALVRYAPKIDHSRMTKDQRGRFLVAELVRVGILIPFDAGKFYRLDQDAMGIQLGMDYIALQQQRFSEESDAFLEGVLANFDGQ